MNYRICEDIVMIDRGMRKEFPYYSTKIHNEVHSNIPLKKIKMILIPESCMSQRLSSEKLLLFFTQDSGKKPVLNT